MDSAETAQSRRVLGPANVEFRMGRIVAGRECSESD